MAPDVLDEAVSIPGFETIRRLGRGGMGVVYLARQVSLNRQVAIKILPPLPRAESATRAERFRREAELMARVAHPNVVAIYDFGVADGRPYLVMEYVAGGDLRRSISADRPLDAARVRVLIDPIARALTCLHRAGILHRDLKPANILMKDGQTPKVADFGIAVPGGWTGDGPSPGTPGYVAPEQQYGLKVDERCDQYSLAAVAYELLTGRRPLGTSFEPPSRFHRGVPKDVDDAIMRGLSEDRDDRFATVEEFAASLDRALANSPAPRRRRLWPVVAALVGLAAIAVVAMILSRPGSPGSSPQVAVQSVGGGSPAAAPTSDGSKAEPPGTFTNQLGMTMHLIRPGEFTMGSPPEDADAWADERPQHRVSLTIPFYLAECEVTNRQFRTFVDSAGYRTEAERSGLGGHIYDAKVKNLVRDPSRTFRTPSYGRVAADDEPVVQVTWNDARAFCDWLAKLEGRPYRLPSEAEWEYACRAGTTTRWSTGKDPATLDDSAWTQRNAGGRLHPVGQKRPNAWGLRDMHGNAWEWCEDWFGGYPSGPVTDPRGLPHGDKKALRGGSWDYDTVSRTSSASRLPDPPDRAHFTHGFRVAIGPDGSPRPVAGAAMKKADHARQLEIARCLFRESNDALLVFDPGDLRVVDLNPAALRLTGLDRREALALRLTDLIVADAPEALDRLVEANRDTTFFHSQEGYSVVRQEGAPIPVNVSVTRVHVEPAPLGLAVVRDVSERRRAQETLDRFFRLSPALFAILDAEGRVTRANAAWETLLGHHPDDLAGTRLIDLVHDDDRAATRAATDGLARTGVASFENRCRHREGSYHRLAWKLASSQGTTYAVASDVTERERTRELEMAKEASEAAGRAKDRFLAVLSHELRTPLNPILLGVTYLLESGEAPDSLRPTFEMIRRNVELEARLIDDLLDVTKILQDKLRLELADADAHAVLRRAVEVCRGEIDEKGLRVAVDLSADRHVVRGDGARLQQVFWNLIKNAVKFTPAGGSLAIRSRSAGEPGRPRLVLEFADSGRGIAAGDLGRIFDPFQQGTADVGRVGGLGLGLSISRGIVEAHGGTIAAESPGPGRGATFRVELDAIPTPTAPDQLAPRGGGDDRGASSLRILLVEDEPETLDVFARILRSLGHRVATATTLGEAVSTALAGEFDLIISDVGLPDGSGLDLPGRLRGRKSTPAIAVSGFGMKEDVRRSLEAGFAAHLVKPIGFKELEATICQALA